MPYTIDDFPIETKEPKIDVILPLGRHVLELVVVDSAGLRSAPATVVITVEQEVPEPGITGISPVGAKQGTTIKAVIQGENLLDATTVQFKGEGVTAQIVSGGTDMRLPIIITIKSDATLGSRSFEVITPGGTAQSPKAVIFIVQPKAVPPSIGHIDPRGGRQGTEVNATIFGKELHGATTVQFQGEGVTAKIEPGGTANSLPILITIDDNAPLGSRSFSVTAPGGTAESPRGVVFTVEKKTLPQNLSDVSGIGPRFTARLRENDIRNLTELAAADPTRVAAALTVSEERARSFIEQASLLLIEQPDD